MTPLAASIRVANTLSAAQAEKDDQDGAGLEHDPTQWKEQQDRDRDLAPRNNQGQRTQQRGTLVNADLEIDDLGRQHMSWSYIALSLTFLYRIDRALIDTAPCLSGRGIKEAVGDQRHDQPCNPDF